MEHLPVCRRSGIENRGCEWTSRIDLWLLLLLTLVFLFSFVSSVFATGNQGFGFGFGNKKPVISFTSLAPATSKIDINGINLHNGTNPEVFLGLRDKKNNTVEIPLVVDAIDVDGKQVIAILPTVNPLTSLPFKNGTYLLTVQRSGKRHRHSAEFHLTIGSSPTPECPCEGLASGATAWANGFDTAVCKLGGPKTGNEVTLIGEGTGLNVPTLGTELPPGVSLQRCFVSDPLGGLQQIDPITDSQAELCRERLIQIATNDDVICKSEEQ